VLPYLAPGIGVKITSMPGVEVTVSERCVGCGACTQGVCFVQAIRLVDGRAAISDACRGCGRCVEVCPEQAINLSVRSNALIGELVDRISGLVDVT
jgi:MinD superfamily P-loop ATPase